MLPARRSGKVRSPCRPRIEVAACYHADRLDLAMRWIGLMITILIDLVMLSSILCGRCEGVEDLIGLESRREHGV